MEEAQAEAARRRRRKSSTRRKAATWPEYWRGPDFGRHLFIAMGLVGAAYAGTILWETRLASRNYPPLKIGMTQSEVSYMLGAPRTLEAGGSVYRYSERGRELAVRFSSAGRMESITCAAGAPAPPTCQKMLGIGIGTHEYDLLLRLGAPSRETFRGDEKTMFYDGMGMSFRLRLLEVEQVELHKAASSIGFVPPALIAMIP